MYNENQISAISNRMINHIAFCKNQNMELGDMFEYVGQDFDLNNIEISNIFNKVFFANFNMYDFAK